MSSTALEQVAARSYAHDNGFTKIVLLNGRDGGGALRLHVWPPQEADNRGNIHNHCWDFTSLVLAGNLEYEEYEEHQSGTTYARHLIYDPSGDFEYVLRPLGTATLRITRAGTRVAGDAYFMSAETLHRTGGRQGTRTVTLVRQGVHRRKHADVYVTREVAVEARNNPLEPNELGMLLKEVMTLLLSMRF